MTSDLEVVEQRLSDDRTVACWITRPAPSRDAGIAVVLCSAFGRRMHQHSSLAGYLRENGLSVLRFDALNHVGMSTGEPEDYTLSDGFRSLEAALEVARQALPGYRLGLVASSLNARLALQALARDSEPAFLISVSGVLDVAYTLTQALGEDYTSWELDRLPPTVHFEGQTIGSRGFYIDFHQAGWADPEQVLAFLAANRRPVAWFVGERDDWIARDNLRRCHAVAPEGSFTVITLRDCGHDVSRNPAMARRIQIEITKRCLLHGGASCEGLREPDHGLLLQSALAERRMQRAMVGEGQHGG